MVVFSVFGDDKLESMFMVRLCVELEEFEGSWWWYGIEYWMSVFDIVCVMRVILLCLYYVCRNGFMRFCFENVAIVFVWRNFGIIDVICGGEIIRNCVEVFVLVFVFIVWKLYLSVDSVVVSDGVVGKLYLFWIWFVIKMGDVIGFKVW